jgi:AcrR family transcriptional regulator
MRRTQQERREGTIRRLLDAATETLIELGHAEASVQRICARAGLSQGALFRHFPSREALMVAVGADVGARLLEEYSERFRLRRRGDDLIASRGSPADAARRRRSAAQRPLARPEELATAMALVRGACRSRLNQAWYELSMAARTSPALRRGLAPVARRYHAAIARAARELLPELADALGDRFDGLVATIIAVFDGEAVQRFVIKQPAAEEARFALLVGLARGLTSST